MEWVLLLHIAGGAVLFGGHVYMEGLMAAANRDGDAASSMTTMIKASKTAGRLMGPASLVTLIFGIWLVVDSSFYEFEQFFIAVGFAVIIAAFAISMFLMNPKMKEIDAAVEENGLADEGAAGTMKSLANLVHVQTLLVAFAFIVMVIKPGL